jgi:soluble lytic murein transglycosylase-like protein/tetrahydromethanopterin S-methyltransferase subunit G
MSDDSTTDKFVLQYSTDAAQALKDLDSLTSKMDKLNEKAEKSESKLKVVGKSVGENLSKVTPEIAGIIGVVGELSGALSVVTTVIAAIVIGFVSMNKLMKEYNQQRDLAFKSGMNVGDIENFQRQLNSSSGGRIGSEQSRSIIDRTQSLAFGAYTNTNPLSRESLMLREAGTSPFQANGNIKSTNQILDDMTKKFKSVSDTMAQAIGQTIGFTHDEVEAIRNRNESIKNTVNMTTEERIRREEAITSMDKLKNVTGDIGERFRQIGNDIGAELVPALAEFLTWIDKLIIKIQGLVRSVLDKMDFASRVRDQIGLDYAKDGVKPHGTPSIADYARAASEVSASDKNRADELQRQQNQNTQDSREATALFTRDINLFSSAVSTFAGVIDERAALAAWAGGAGQASGLTAIPNTSTGGSSKPLAADMMVAIRQAVKGTNVPPELLAGVVSTESGGNVNAVSHDKYGTPIAYGAAQINKSNFGKYHITNPFDLKQNLNAAAQILNENLAKSGGDVEQALRYYNGGYDQRNWGPQNAAYPGKVLGYTNSINPNSQGFHSVGYQGSPRNIGSDQLVGTGSGGRIKGLVPQDLGLMNAQSAIASNLGIHIAQIQQGGRISKGDIDFSREQLEYGVMAQIQRDQLMMNASGALPKQRAQAAIDLRTQSFNLQSLKNYGPQVEASGRMGGREITVNEKGVWIQVDGARDPLITGNAVKNALTGALSPDIDQMTNSVVSGIKY